MIIEREHSYLIRDYKELRMFLEELKRIGKFSKNSYLETMLYRFNESFIRLSVDNAWDIVHGSYPKDEPIDTKSLTRYQKESASTPYNKYPCTLWSRKTIKYNKDRL